MSMRELAWAMKLDGVSPVAKLVAIRIADDSPQPVAAKVLAEFCCVDIDQLYGAIAELEECAGVKCKELPESCWEFGLPIAEKESSETRAVNRRRRHLYVMSYDRKVKIGIAFDLETRRLSLEQHLPQPVVLEWATAGESYLISRAERQVHQALQAHRIFGEWFCCSVDDAIEKSREFTAAFAGLGTRHVEV
jgi:hypothetical protein